MISEAKTKNKIKFSALDFNIEQVAYREHYLEDVEEKIFQSTIIRVIILIPVLVNVAFFTLIERKILGLRQSRKGPNKTSLVGILQPASDAAKLFTKEYNYPKRVSLLFLLAPSLALTVILVRWQITPLGQGEHMNWSILVLLMVLRLNLYPLLMAGWSSNRKYALIGALRGVAQTISYEIRLALIILTLAVSTNSLELSRWSSCEIFFTWAICLPLLVFWVVRCLAETNRTPFDFAEGESELVSGFNIEYGAGGFALIFMAEYGRIMFLSIARTLLTLNLRGWGWAI